MSKHEDSKFPKAKPAKPTSSLSLPKLSNVRIIQKNLVYVIGLSSNLANKETLSRQEYFGQYGNISKIVVNKNKAYNPNGPNGPSFSAYISYNSPQDASMAILAIDNIEVDDHILRASFGTTKYCTFFLKNSDCPNKECLYLHSIADEGDIINRDDMNNKNIFYEQQILAMKIGDIFNPDIKKKLLHPKKIKSILPSLETIYNKDIVIDEDTNNININKCNKFCNKKKYEYDDFKYYEDNNEEVEYILVREKKKDKFKNNIKTKKTKKITTYNKNKDINNNEEKNRSFSPEPITCTSDNNQNNSGNENNECKDVNIFRKRNKSRFDFVSNCTNQQIEVPEFIYDMLYRKISRYTFFKKFICMKENMYDIKFFEKELRIDDSWAQFIKSNISLEV